MNRHHAEGVPSGGGRMPLLCGAGADLPSVLHPPSVPSSLPWSHAACHCAPAPSQRPQLAESHSRDRTLCDPDGGGCQIEGGGCVCVWRGDKECERKKVGGRKEMRQRGGERQERERGN